MSTDGLDVYYFKKGNGWIRSFGVIYTFSTVPGNREIILRAGDRFNNVHCLPSLSDGAMTTRMRRVKTYSIEYVNKDEVLQKYFMKML